MVEFMHNSDTIMKLEIYWDRIAQTNVLEQLGEF